MHLAFDSQLKDAFSSHNKKTGKYSNDFDFNDLIDIYWQLLYNIEWEKRMDEERKHMDEYHNSLLDDFLKTD